MTATAPNAILVFHAAGVVDHRFCDAEYAESFTNDPANRGCAAFLYKEGSAETLFAVSPQIRERVEEAKRKLREDLRIEAALDKHAVCSELEVRHSLHQAFSDLRFEMVRAALARNSLQLLRYSDQQLHTALSKFGVPADLTLRQAVTAAFLDLVDN